MAEASTLEGLFKNNDLHDKEILEALAADPFRITTIKQFANYFDDKSQITTIFLPQCTFLKGRGDLVAGLKQAWREADAAVTRVLKRTADNVNDDQIDEPLKYDAQARLETAWKAHYRFVVPDGWMGFSSMLGRFHREFLRRTHTVFHVTKVRNLEQITIHGPAVKHQRVGQLDVSFGSGEPSIEVPVSSVFTYIMALKAVLFTMSMAGTFVVKKGESEVFFLPLQQVLDHLASAEGYALKHATGRDRRSDNNILKQLTTIDESIRCEWARILRSNVPDGVTMGEAISDSKNYAGAMWLMPPTESMPQQHNWAESSPRPTKQPDKNRSPGGKGKGGGKGKDGKSPGPEKYQLKIKTARAGKDGKRICKPFNDSRGCATPQCPEAHVCDVLTPLGDACNSSGHSRTGHRGPTVPL